jgi:hypothetical protein
LSKLPSTRRVPTRACLLSQQPCVPLTYCSCSTNSPEVIGAVLAVRRFFSRPQVLRPSFTIVFNLTLIEDSVVAQVRVCTCNLALEQVGIKTTSHTNKECKEWGYHGYRFLWKLVP